MKLTMLQTIGKFLLIAVVIVLAWLLINRQQETKREAWATIPDKKDLIPLLEQAAELSAKFHGGGTLGRFDNTEELTKAINVLVAELKTGDFSRLHEAWIWFAPTCSWDDLVGIEGQDLANEIFEKLNRIPEIKAANNLP